MPKGIIGNRRILRAFADFFLIAVGYTAAFLLRFDFHPSSEQRTILLTTVIPFAFAQAAVLLWSDVYRWFARFWGAADLIELAKAWALGSVASAVVVAAMQPKGFPFTVLLIAPALIALGLIAIRAATRFFREGREEIGGAMAIRVVIVGAGSIGESLARQMLKSLGPNRYQVVGFIDDSEAKWRMRIHGVPVLGGREALSTVLRQNHIDEIIVAISQWRGDLIRFISDAARLSGSSAKIKIAPNLEEMLIAPGKTVGYREIRPADLLPRSIVELSDPDVERLISGKRVLVTGAGGTIGSELCRQVLAYRPSHIFLVDNHSTSLFYAEKELAALNRGTIVVSLLGSVADRPFIERVYQNHAPKVIFHAAAHKHQPQLESNVLEGIQNNILATYYLAEAAHRHRAESFLLISTDKAVRPSSVMGATKRVAELIVQHIGSDSPTRFMGVRFGNVLGSSGSVLEIFCRQISKGGPVTITHPEVKRYFMTAQEAVGLILHAGGCGTCGQIFVLKMGHAVRIVDLATSLIQLHGLVIGRDISIEVTGLRPGEKLDEELFEDPAEVISSGHPDILMLKPGLVGASNILAGIQEFERILAEMNETDALTKLMKMVPSYDPQGSPNPAPPVVKPASPMSV